MSKQLQIPQSTLDEQFSASDPKRFSWVSANAGSGKTHVLTQRVIRLMLAGNAPDKILCLTFTKAAAANMKNRVFGTLASWTMMEDEELVAEIKNTTGRTPSGITLHRARQLFAESLDTPGGLKIQTIHAFCESLLHQFPLEANVSGHFEVIQETTQAAMLAEAKAHVLGHPDHKEVLGAFSELAPVASDAAIETAITEIISKRHRFQDWILNTDKETGSVDLAIDTLYSALGVEQSETVETIQDGFLETLIQNNDFLKTVMRVTGETGKKTDQTLSDKLELYFKSWDTDLRFNIWRDICFTQKGEFRTEKSIATTEVKTQFPDLVEIIFSIGELFLHAIDKIKALGTIEKSRHLFKIAYAVLERYERMKRSRGQIDYDDQIWKTVNLLKRPDIRDWIRYRLDQGIDHVLVDEAQDTSPAQWEIINAVTEDFYAGEGAAKKDRTVFVVGDEKQSIYSFQGASPKEFNHQKRLLNKKVSALGKDLKNARLDLSFRSTLDVLHAVDCVFDIDENAQGLTREGNVPPHDAVRRNDPGEVQVWPVFAREKTETPENWLDPIDRDRSDDPAVLLAERIANTIKQWVGQPLPGTGDPLKFGDILILVRKRDRFITALTRTLKDQGLAVAGADRLRLIEHIAVEDLLAIGRFVLLPEDDLNLAAVLKGAFINITDPQLFHLAHDRKERSLFHQLEVCAKNPDNPAHGVAHTAFELLKQIRSKGQTLSLFDFYAWVLGAFGGRKKLLAQMGMEAEDVIDAFIDEIISFTRDGGNDLENFIAQLTKANPEIKRELELERDEVRILTTHASKGLEARVVFLVDSCGKSWISNHRPKIVEIDTDRGEKGFVWIPTSSDQVSKTLEITQEAEKAADAEYRRLLYVGMTRAADRLIVCGYRGTREPKHDYWHRMVETALTPTADPIPEEEGGGLRWVIEERPAIPAKTQEDAAHQSQEDKSLPDWLLTPAKADPPLPRPLTPSGAYALIDENLKHNRNPAFEAMPSDSPYALQIGTIVHQLLEILPEMPVEDRMATAEAYVGKYGAEWQQSARHAVLSNIQSILETPPFAELFKAEGRAEVPIIGSLETRSGLRSLSGQIDRLVIYDTHIMILDYKTNRFAPEDHAEYPGEYITQLALYRHLVEKIYPDHQIKCALLWTTKPELSIIPDTMLTAALEAVKNG